LIFSRPLGSKLETGDMFRKRQLRDYEPVTRPARGGLFAAEARDNRWRPIAPVAPIAPEKTLKFPTQPTRVGPSEVVESGRLDSAATSPLTAETWISKRGHALSYAGIFVFTFLVYFRPYELFPSLAWLSKSALVVAIFTLAVFIPTQLGLENRITAKPREIKLVFALVLTGILSVPFALEPTRAFLSFVEYLKVVVIFIVMVNVIRTEKRLQSLILLVLFVSCVLSLAALNDYRVGNLALQGRRIEGLIGGLFSNPNDLALHLVTMIPISLTLVLGSRGLINKGLYLVCSLLLMAGMVATFSRGGFLGFICVMGFLVWKLARRNRLIFGGVALAVILATIALAPSAYRSRITTTNDDSAVARTDDLKRSILVAARHPFFGVGMDNYILYSNLSKATHNAYTQVAAEMGAAGFLMYLLFLITPFKRLRKIEQATWSAKRKPRLYYLAVGLQASLVGYMVVSFFASVAYQWYVFYIIAYAICLGRICSHPTEDTRPGPLQQRNSSNVPSRNDGSSLSPIGSTVMGGN
jgi:probable O-glycosylation ligase (exosortase A-associated)